MRLVIDPVSDGQRHDIITRLDQTWHRRAQVMRHTRGPFAFDLGKQDFLEELLPFVSHHLYKCLPSEIKMKILSCGWLAFNNKVLGVERNVLIRACQLLECRDFAKDPNIRNVIAETLIDETYHILLVQQASRISIIHRGLLDLYIPPCTLVEQMMAYSLQQSDIWKRDLILVTTAIVTEAFVCGYLSPLARAEHIQPLHMMTTRAHLADESAHATIFRQLSESLYVELDSAQRGFFLDTVAHAIRWFSDRELSIWRIMLNQIGVRHADQIISDCLTLPEPCLDTIDIVHFLETLGFINVEDRIRSVSG